MVNKRPPKGGPGRPRFYIETATNQDVCNALHVLLALISGVRVGKRQFGIAALNIIEQLLQPAAISLRRHHSYPFASARNECPRKIRIVDHFKHSFRDGRA
jgi:hypothetical protein